MKQTLQLKIGQTLTMTPQLQQAIRLLQLSTLELQTEVQTILDSNPMLEQDEGEQEPVDKASDDGADDSPGTAATEETMPAENTDTIPDELPTDSSWDDTYDSGLTNLSAPGHDDRRDIFETMSSGSEGLQDHLHWQLDMANLSDTDRLVGNTLIDTIDDDGYLTQDTGEIHNQLVDRLPGLDRDEVDAVLHLIQQFDPAGVGARDLRENLDLQLRRYQADTPWLNEARMLVRDHLNLLASRDYNTLGRRMKLTRDDLQHVVTLIQSLNPRPGSLFSTMEPEYIVPDVFVFKNKDKWSVELNTDAIPKLRINSLYASMVKRATNTRDNNYMRDNLQEARWFLKSLQSRHETLLKVANSIIRRQRAFFDYGEEAMKPMVLRSVAEEVEMHESTISRVTTRKYMHTPRGIYEFKYFFSSHVSTETGGECSATAIRAIIKKLVAAENPVKPLSDSKMALILAEQGIKVARRTIAKYREAMSIAPSNERKRLA
jgi:RNA polymerase sigma-54 factor